MAQLIQITMTSQRFLLTLLLILSCLPLARAQNQLSMVTCKQAAHGNRTCLQCNPNYHLHEGQCYVNIASCISYIFGSICRQCSNGLILVNNECCDSVCMSKIYNEEQHDSKVAENKEEVLRKAEVDGLERSIAIIAKNSVKSGQNYDIVTSKCQRFDKVFRYFVDLEIDGKQYTAINDYNIVTSSSVFINLAVRGEQTSTEVTITEDNIHNNVQYGRAYKFVYEKFGLQLYELECVRMTARLLGKFTELKFVFLGVKALIIEIMVSEAAEPYVLWKEEKQNVADIKEAAETLKKIDSLTKQQSFKHIFAEVLKTKNFDSADIQILNINTLSHSEYQFVVYQRRLKMRYRVQASYNAKTGKVTIKKVEEVYSKQLQELKEPEPMMVKVITKEMLSKSVQAKQVFDHLIKLRPSFRINYVENIKLEIGQDVSKILIITKKDDKDYRIVVLKDIKSNQMQVIDEGYLTQEHASFTSVTQNNDNTRTITTDKIDISRAEVKVVLESFVENKIQVSVSQIQSLTFTEGPKSIEYVAVIKDSSGHPYKQVTIIEEKSTKKTTIVDEISLTQEVNIIRPKAPEFKLVPATDYYKTQIKEIISKVETKVSQDINISKVTKIEYTNTTEATKFHFTAEDSKGRSVTITAVQPRGETTIEVINVHTAISSSQQTTVESKTVKKVTQYGVKVEFTTDRQTITSNQNVNVALTSITTQYSDLVGYKVVSAKSNTFVQNQEQVLVMTNGEKTVQVVGTIDLKTLRYNVVERREIALESVAPVVVQISIPTAIYQSTLQENVALKYSETVLLQKYKMFRNKVPSLTVIESHSTIDVITTSYEVGQKKFTAVVYYDKVTRENTKVLEVNSVDITAAVTVDQRVYQGKTVTVSNSIEQIQTENAQTKTILGKVLLEYPLLKKHNVTEIRLTESEYSNVFQVTYSDSLTKHQTTVTVRSDLQGKMTTIDNIQTSQTGNQLSATSTVFVYKKEEFKSVAALKILSVVSTKLTVDTVTNIVSESYPSYTISKVTLLSLGRSYEVTVMESKQRQEVLAVRSTSNEVSITTTKAITTTQIDDNGNTIIRTTDLAYIKTLFYVAIAVNEIRTTKPQMSTWNLFAVVEVDYGTAKQLTITLAAPAGTQQIKFSLIYYKTTKTVKVVSTKTTYLTSSLTTNEELFESVTAPLAPVTTIPQVVIVQQIKIDKKLQTVVTQIQKIDIAFVNVLPRTTQIQILSETATLYTAVLQIKGAEKQVVVLHDSTTNTVSVISSTTIDQSVKPYYISQTTTASGTVITSNNVQQLVSTHTELTSILDYSKQWVAVKSDWTNVAKVRLESSPISGTRIYTIETVDSGKIQTIEISYNEVTRQKTVINLAVTPVQVIYPVATPVVTVDVTKQTTEVKSYLTTIQQSNIATLQTVKEIVSIHTEQSQHYNKTYAEVITKDNKTVKVTLLAQEGQKTTVVNVEAQQSTRVVVENKKVESVDRNGNQVIHITGSQHISKNIITSTTLQTVLTQNQVLEGYVAISAQTVNYGIVQQVTLILTNTVSGQTVQATSFFNSTSKTVSVVSVQATASLTFHGEAGYQFTTPQTPKPSYPTVIIPKLAIIEVTKEDMTLSKVITYTKQISVNYANVLPTTMEVQQLSESVKKCTLVMETKTSKEQIVLIHDSKTSITTTISSKPIPAVIDQTYIQQQTLQTGQILYTSNNVETMTARFQDLKVVMEKVQQTVTGFTLANTVVSVLPKGSLNSYVIESVVEQQKVTVQLNYDFSSSTAYVTHYQTSPVEIAGPSVPQYLPQVLTNTQKLYYLEIIKSSEYVSVRKTVNIISSKTASYAMYNETVVEVQSAINQRHYVRFIQYYGETTLKIVQVTPLPSPDASIAPISGEVASAWQTTVGVTVIAETSEQTVTKTDEHGNQVIESSDIKVIYSNPLTTVVFNQLMKAYPDSRDYSIKYFKTVAYGNVVEVTTKLQGTETSQLDIKSVCFYDKTTQKIKVVSVEKIDILTETQIQTSTAVYTTVVVSDSSVNVLAQKDTGFKQVLTTLQQTSLEYKSATAVSTQVQVLSNSLTKYNVMVEVANRKEEKVYIYNSVTKQTELHATVIVPAEIKPLVIVEQITSQQKTVVSNQIQTLKISYPETTTVLSALKKEIPNVQIDTVMVTSQSSSSEVTLVSTSTSGKEILVNKYVQSEGVATKVSRDTIKISQIVATQQVYTVKVSATVITTISAVQAEVLKILSLNTTAALPIDKIQEVTMVTNANLQIYYIKTVNADGKPVKAEITYNSATGQATVVDVSVVVSEKVQRTATVIKEITGVVETIVVNSAAVTQGKEFQQISDFITKNHPSDMIQAGTAVLSDTEKYQRSVLKTYVFKQENSTIQCSYLVDQRTNSVVELQYNVIPGPLVNQFVLPIKKETTLFVAEKINTVITTEVSVKKTLTSITKVDSTLSTLTPIAIETENYANSTIVTVVYDTPQSNSRILTIYNKVTGEAKVIDYSKIHKKIEESRVIETINIYGQKSVQTDNASAVTTKEYAKVVTVVEQLVPAIKGKIIRSVETTVKTTGTQYKLVTLQKGVINYVTVFSDKNNAVSLISSSETTVAQAVTAITQQTAVQTTLDLQTLQSSEISTLVQTVISESGTNFDSNSTVIAGSVTDYEYVSNYELQIASSYQTTKTVRITREKASKKVIMRQIRAVPMIPVFRPITTLQTDSYGNVRFLTNSYAEISQSVQIQTVIRKIYRFKPQISTLRPISTQTTTIGHIVQTVVVFGAQNRPGVQVTSFYNIKTEEVTVIDYKVIRAQIKTTNVEILPVFEVQNIPVAAIPVATRKFLELKSLIATVEKTGKVISLTVENMQEVKKYTVVSETATGKVQQLFVFNKGTKTTTLAQTVNISATIEAVSFKTTINEFGETVTTSNNLQQVVIRIPEVISAVAQIKKKYNIDISNITKLVESKGTTTKEIKIVTQLNYTQQQTVFTISVSGGVATVIDVQSPKLPAHTTTDLIRTITSESTKTVSVQQSKSIVDVVFSNSVINQHFSTNQVKHIRDTSTSFVNSYEVTVQNSNGVTANVTLVQQDGQALTIVDVNTHDSITRVVKQEATTTTTVNVITGNKVTTTNDAFVISNDIAISQLTHNVVAQLPQLIGYTLGAVTTTTYNNTSESQLTFQSGEQTVAVTTLFNTATKKTTVISTQITTGNVSAVTVHNIPVSAIPVAVKKWVEVDTILSNIKTTIATATVETLTVKELADVKIYTSVLRIAESTESKTQVVYVYDKKTMEVKEIDRVIVPWEITPVTTVTTVDVYGQTVVKTNDISGIALTYPSVSVLFAQIETNYGVAISKAVKSIEIKEQTEFAEYKLITEVNGKLAEVIAIKQNNEIKVLGLDLVTSTQTQQSISQTSITTAESSAVQVISIKSQVATLLTNTIETSTFESLKKAEIVSITAADSYISTVYTVTTKDSKNKIQQVTISVSPDQTAAILHVSEISKTTTSAEVTVETQSSKQVSTFTGQTITITNKQTQVDQQTIKITPEVIKLVPQVAHYQAVSIKVTQLGELTWNTVVYSENKEVTEKRNVTQVTVVLNTTDSKVTVVETKSYTVEVNVSAMPQTTTYNIPSVAIITASKKLVEVSQVITEVAKTYKKEQIESMEMQVFGQTQKISTVVLVGTERTVLSYIFNKTSGEIKPVDSASMPAVIQAFTFQQETNYYGETTTITNKATEIVTAIPDVETGIKYIHTKFPVIVNAPTVSITTTEYPSSYRLTYISQVEASNQVSVVVSIDKATREVQLISTYTQNDIVQTTQVTQSQTTQLHVEVVATTSQMVINIVKFIESTPSLSVSSIKTIINAQKTTTLYGIEVVTVEAITVKNVKVKFEVNYNAVTQVTTLNDFTVLEQLTVAINTVTKFTVDLVTGAKVSTTNNSAAIESSSILQSITQSVTSIAGNQKWVMTHSSSTQYSETIKVVSIFIDQSTKQLTRVVSIVNKNTSKVHVVDSRATVTATIDLRLQTTVYTSKEVTALQTQNARISKVFAYIEGNFRRYAGHTPETLIVESLQRGDIVIAIYQTSATVKSRLIAFYNQTSKTTTINLLDSSQLPSKIDNFFYEETQKEGQKLVISSSLSEVEQRIETATLVTEFISRKTLFAKEQVQSVQVVVASAFQEYTVVAQTSEGVVQHQFLVNLHTNSVTQIDRQIITAQITVFEPKKPVVIGLTPNSQEAQPILDQIIKNPDIGLNTVESILSITKEDSSKVTKLQIEYAGTDKQVNKILVTANKTDNQILITDERKVTVDFVQTATTVVRQTIDEISKTAVTLYPSVQTFKLDADSTEIRAYIEKNVPESTKYRIESVRKQTFGSVVQYEVLFKGTGSAPMQVTIAKDNANRNIIMLESRKISERVEKSAIESSVQSAVKLEVSDIEKENIKVLSKLGMVKDIKDYKELKLEVIATNEQFMAAVSDVKIAYSALLSGAVIIKTLQKKSLEYDSFKVFFRAKDQIYEASIQLNAINGETKLTEFIKVGTQTYTKSEVNVYSDLCYGYQPIEDLSLDANLDFISNYLKQKYDSLKDSSLLQAQQIALSNGRINYKIYFKKDSATIKYIVYYEPEYKRVLEIKGASFSIGDQYRSLPKDQQIYDPYFRKLDTYVRQNSDLLTSASIMHTESKDDGHTIQFRTVYTSNGKSFRSTASIDKENQSVNEGTLSEIIQVPLERKDASASECNNKQAKLDIHDVGKNAYFTECYSRVMAKYPEELRNAQLLGAGEESKFNTFTYELYFIVDQATIITTTVEFNPLTQAVKFLSGLETISLQADYYPIKSGKNLAETRDYLRQNKPDLSNSVLVASLAKKFYFGTLFKMVFKVSTKYIAFVVYMDCATKEKKIYDTQELDNYYPSKGLSVGASAEGSAAESSLEGSLEGSLEDSAEGSIGSAEGGDLQVTKLRPSTLKGFARPMSSTN